MTESLAGALPVRHPSGPFLKLKRYQTRARELVHKAKETPCKDCGRTYPYYVMQFDHLDPKLKVREVSRMVQSGVSEATLLAEIQKCEVVCANCHATRTHFRKNPVLVA